MIKKQLMTLFALLTCILLAGQALASTERFDYDPLGRLIRSIGADNKATSYVYDAAGNLLEVNVDGVVAAPSITNITPSSLRRGETKAVTLSGTGFVGASVETPSGTGLSIKNLQIAATQVTFDLSASESAVIGPQVLTLSSAAGSAATSLTVAPLMPRVHVDPAPLAIPPDSATRQFTVRLSHADVIDHVVALSASNTNMQVTPESVAIPAGQTSAQANIKGVSAGQSTLTLSSATLGTTSVPVFITAEFRGITTSFAAKLGVVVEIPPQQKTQQITPVTNPLVGVILGSAIRHTSPSRINVGTQTGTLTLYGNGLGDAQTIAIEPSAGVTLGAPVAAADGFTVSVPISVAADAPVSPRRLVLRNAGGAVFPPANPWADRIDVVRPAPQIESISPLFGIANTTFEMTIRGKNLHAAEAVMFNPSTGIATDATPVVSNDGTLMTARVRLGFDTPTGPYTVAVATPGGTSGHDATSQNTFNVVDEIHNAITPIVAATLGVTVEADTPPVSTSYGMASPVVSVIRGSAIKAVTPAVGIVGEQVTLTLQGAELPVNAQLHFVPDTGITVMRDDITVAADGASMTVPLVIAADAPQTLRRMMVADGERDIPFATAEVSRFQVSLPMPEIESVTPIMLQTGQAPISLTIRGKNLKEASAVKVTPPTDMTISTPPVVNGNGTEVTVSISATSNAETGPRVVTVVTPAGESPATLSANNTITLGNSAGSTYTPIVAPLVGVVKQTPHLPESVPVGPISAPLVGVVIEAIAQPVSTSFTHHANTIGLAVGPTAFGLSADGFAPGYEGTLTITGQELSNVTSVSVIPADGISFDAPVIAADGKSVSVAMTVGSDVPHGWRNLTLGSASGLISFVDPNKSRLRVGPGVPHFDSITPIVAEQGSTVNMTIRGARLHDAIAVVATPGSGIRFVPDSLSVNAAGTELTVSFTVDTDAPIGSRVIQVLVPGAESTATPGAANTFTVYSKN